MELDNSGNCGIFRNIGGNVSPLPWFAARVRSKFERVVAKQLSAHDIQCYVPLVILKKPDYKKLESVLIPGYCFVHADQTQHRAVLDTIGVCGFVTFQNEPAEIPESEILVLQSATNPKFMAKEHYGFTHRQAVKIVGTPFDGYIATVDYVSGTRVRVILPMSIGRQVSVEVQAENVIPLETAQVNPPHMVEVPFGVN